jgi:hypothetical protein
MSEEQQQKSRRKDAIGLVTPPNKNPAAAWADPFRSSSSDCQGNKNENEKHGPNIAQAHMHAAGNPILMEKWKSGGEGGIRTLGTGVRPQNGL